MPAKRCGQCGRSLALSSFARDRTRADGRMGRCKRCDRKRNREYYATTGRQRAASKPGPIRMCAACDQPATSQRHRYCDACRPAHAAMQTPGRTAKNGYAAEHKALRRRLEPIVAAGGVDCARCGEPIDPEGPWDLGHDDEDRLKYNGPEHVRCNRRAPVLRRRAGLA